MASITLDQEALVHNGPMLAKTAILRTCTITLEMTTRQDDEMAAHWIACARYHEEDCTIGATSSFANDVDTLFVSAQNSALEPVLLCLVHRHTVALALSLILLLHNSH